MPVRLALLTLQSTDPLARVWLSCGVVNSLYRSMICLDFADLLSVLSGKGVAYWRHEEQCCGVTSRSDSTDAIALPESISGVFYGRIAGADLSIDNFLHDVGVDLSTWLEDDDVEHALVLAALNDAKRKRGHGSFVLSTGV
ncbi:MAG TPA: hypothetical protein VKA14_05830 [Gammaproteobacteria bacterium]|nr:hypothetical protein [Gammaproteobacteria bacterium]